MKLLQVTDNKFGQARLEFQSAHLGRFDDGTEGSFVIQGPQLDVGVVVEDGMDFLPKLIQVDEIVVAQGQDEIDRQLSVVLDLGGLLDEFPPYLGLVAP